MVVVFFNSCKKWGGGEKWHLEMATGLHRQGVEVYAFANKKSLLYERLEKNNIKVFPVSVTALSVLNPFKIIKLKRQLTRLKAGTVILNLSADVKFAGLSSKLAGVKHIIYRRGSAIPIKNSISNRFIFKQIITHALANSQETKRTILANNTSLFEESKIEVIYNGIDPNKYDLADNKLFSTKDDQPVILGNLARLSKQKAQDHLIEVCSQLKEKKVNFRMLIGGDGELLDELKQKVAQANLENEIEFLGFIKEVSSFYKRIDLFLFPSIWEGFGFSLVEAKLFKKPIVAYNVSSNPEVICDNKDGILIPLNDKSAFADAVYRLIKSADLVRAYGEHGYKDVNQRFLFSQSISKLRHYLQGLE